MGIHRGRASRLLTALLSALLLAAPGAMAASDDDSAKAVEKRIAEARKQLDEAARRLGELHREMWELERDSPSSDRPMLGVLVDDAGGPDGLEVVGVTPEGGAEQAGLKAGDRLVMVNGVALDGDSEASSLARLAEALGSATAGEPVGVTYVRDGRRIDAEIVPQPRRRFIADMLREPLAPLPPLPPLPDLEIRKHLEALEELEHLDMGPLVEQLEALGREASPFVLRHVARVPAGLELRNIGPVLGRYFGVDGGVLVLETPAADGGLQPGDVLLSLDGEAVADAGEAAKALGAATGEVALTVRRQGRERRLTVDGAKLNERQDVQVETGGRRVIIQRGGAGSRTGVDD